jgi:hypothetical protein
VGKFEQSECFPIASLIPSQLRRQGGALFFSARSGQKGLQSLWKTKTPHFGKVAKI